MWPFVSLDPARRWGLAAGGPLSAWNKEPFNRLRSRHAPWECAQMLSEGWSIRGRDDVLRTIDWLVNQGHTADASQVIEASATGYVPLCDDPDGRIAFALRNQAELRSKGLVAWDLGRLISVARWSCTAGYISSDEAWDWISLASTRIQSCYQSWEDCGRGWLLGYGYWKDGGEIDKAFLERLNWLNRSARSPWKRIEWDTLLESGAKTRTISVDVSSPRRQPEIAELRDTAHRRPTLDAERLPGNLGISKKTPTQFRGKTWIFIVQALVFGGLGGFSLLLGPLFLFGVMKDAAGKPAVDAGIALSIMSVPLLLIFTLAVFNLVARRRPILRICREGIEINVIGSSALDDVPLIPGVIRVAWLVVSFQGFRQQTVRAPWAQFREVQISGAPMVRVLTIYASFLRRTDMLAGQSAALARQISFRDADFDVPLDQIASAIVAHSEKIESDDHLPSWDD